MAERPEAPLFPKAQHPPATAREGGPLRGVPDDGVERLSAAGEELRVPLVEEELRVATRKVETGRIRVSKTVIEREEMVEAALRHEGVEVTRVPVNRPVDVVPPVREEDGVLVMPVVEEELVVSRRLVLREEVHVRRTAGVETVREPVTVRQEEATVERLPPRGPADPA